MKIKFAGKYKSLSSFESEELSNFTVITGKNGTGKSQLVYCIDQSQKSIETPNGIFNLEFEPKSERIQISDLIYESSGSVDTNAITAKLKNYYSEFEKIKVNNKLLYDSLLKNNVHLRDFIKYDASQTTNLLKIENLKEYCANIIRERRRGFKGQHLSENEVLKIFKDSLSLDIELFDIFKTIKNYKNKYPSSFDRNDFFKTPFPEKYIDDSDMFKSKVETIFLSYLKRRHENDYLNFRNQNCGESHNVIKGVDFEKLYPAPWNLINKILDENKISIRIKGYQVSDYAEDIIMDVLFTKEGVSDFITFNDLSSGEKVIIGLIAKLFTEQYYLTDLKFPELIVLDEPDKSLHPEMSKLLINVLYKSFVERLGIKVIMTTHSPSTVALTPEECIYEMSNIPVSCIKKVSKDSALELLTGMIPTLSIDYKNHKQIFLESPTDVTYFQRLFNKLNSEEQLNFKLYFISNEMGKSNCAWVKAIVSKLREGGVSKSFGIIDWDGKNKSSPEVFVHGENKRYSVENFIYDAIYFSILFLESNGGNNIRKELNFDEVYTQYDLSDETNERLQEIWDWFIKKIEDKFSVLKSGPLEEISYYNGRKVSVPQWFLKMQGHEIEAKLRVVFLSLDKFTSEGDLQNNLSIIMAKCFPLVPFESIELLKILCI
jgi:predicted ATPase